MALQQVSVSWRSITWSRDNEDEKKGNKWNTHMQLLAIWMAVKVRKPTDRDVEKLHSKIG